MEIFPAIDISGGKCVRLIQGLRKQETVYGDDPVEMAQKWMHEGAKRLHIVDLDGAFDDNNYNAHIIGKIAQTVDIPIQMGGGIRSLERLRLVFEMGVKRAILGTAAIEKPDFVEEVVSLYEDRIAIGIDAKEGKVAIRGWTRNSEVDVIELALKMKGIGVKTVIYTDISRDGMLTGPNVEATVRLIETTELDVIASGGISSLDDLVKLKAINVSGVIIGKALYNGNFSLKDALELEE